jgi:hypothetical protein
MKFLIRSSDRGDRWCPQSILGSWLRLFFSCSMISDFDDFSRRMSDACSGWAPLKVSPTSRGFELRPGSVVPGHLQPHLDVLSDPTPLIGISIRCLQLGDDE